MVSAAQHTSLSDFLANLAQDQQALEDYLNDQKRQVEASNLREDHKAALLSNDQNQIIAALNAEYGDQAKPTSVQVIMAPPKWVPQVIMAPPQVILAPEPPTESEEG